MRARIPLIALALAATALAARADDMFIENARQLTFEGRRAGEGYFSPDGTALVFQSEREPGNPFYQIYILSLETGDVHRVSPGTGKTTCAWFDPASNRVLFASTHLDPDAVAKQKEELELRASGKERRYAWDYDEHFDLFFAAREGGHLERLTQARGYDAEGSVSPDGSRIVFCSTRDAYTADLTPEDRSRLEKDAAYFGEIYTMNVDGTNAARLTTWPGYDGGPFFSPDGKRIVWRHFTEEGDKADIYTMRSDGSDRLRVTDFESMCWAPFYHPSGRYVIFTTNKHGFSNFELYIVDTAGERQPVRVTDTDGFDGLPVFSPDGERISWTSNRGAGGQSQIFLGRWNHDAALEALEDSPARDEEYEEETGSVGPSPLRLRVAGYAESEASPEWNPGATAGDLRRTVAALAADEMEGRMTGTEGERKAGAYIAARFAEIGLAPAGKEGYFQEFPFTSGVTVKKADCHLEVTAEVGTKSFTADEDFRPLAFSENGKVEGEVVFAGYGLTTPGGGAGAYDSYAGFDVTDKIVLVLRWVPEEVDSDRRAELNMYAGLRYKAMIARENGAKALLVAMGPTSPNAGELIPLKFDQALAGSGIPVAAVTGDVVDLLFSGYDKTLEEVQTGLDQENPHVEGTFALPGVRVSLETALEREQSTGRNVLAYLPAKEDAPETDVIVIGAHYDHIGYGEVGSLAHKGEEGEIHNGADDNASGTALVLELAAALQEERKEHPERFRKGVLVALWSGEELGLIGSTHWTTQPTVALERVAAYVNFDMVGRMRDNKLMLLGTGSSDVWNRLIEKRNVAAGFDVQAQSDPFLPTDVTAFYPRNVPVLSFFTGSHGDYNRPTDDTETLNYEGMERIAKFALGVVTDLTSDDERPEWIEVERSKEQTGERASLRAYLGTIPDYATGDLEGVKLSGVRGGGPADKAGLRGGDIIVEFGGREIKNIYDYTYAIDAVKIGEPVEVVVLRDGERVTLSIVPEARK